MRLTTWPRTRCRVAATLALHKRQHEWLSRIDLEMMRRALHLARAAGVSGEIPVAAIVYRGEEIICGVIAHSKFQTVIQMCDDSKENS